MRAIVAFNYFKLNYYCICQTLGEKHQTTTELGNLPPVPTGPSSGTSPNFPSTQSATTLASRYHPYQRETSSIAGMKNEIRSDPRLLHKVGGNGGKDKPKDPRLTQQVPPQNAPRPSLAANQVNTNRDPRQRRL